MCPSPTSFQASATSSVEELPGIFSRERKVPRNTAQQLYDVGYVVYGGEREVGGREERGREKGEKKPKKKKRKGKGRQRKTERGII